jgi:hypothetical protein
MSSCSLLRTAPVRRTLGSESDGSCERWGALEEMKKSIRFIAADLSDVTYRGVWKLAKQAPHGPKTTLDPNQNYWKSSVVQNTPKIMLSFDGKPKMGTFERLLTCQI